MYLSIDDMNAKVNNRLISVPEFLNNDNAFRFVNGPPYYGIDGFGISFTAANGAPYNLYYDEFNALLLGDNYNNLFPVSYLSLPCIQTLPLLGPRLYLPLDPLRGLQRRPLRVILLHLL